MSSHYLHAPRDGHRLNVFLDSAEGIHRIREQGVLVWRLLAAGGYVYVCGSLAVRDAVRDAFADVAAEKRAAAARARAGLPARIGEDHTLPPRSLGLTLGAVWMPSL